MIKANFVCIIYLNPFKFSCKCLSIRLELVAEFPKIVPSAFEPFPVLLPLILRTILFQTHVSKNSC